MSVFCVWICVWVCIYVYIYPIYLSTYLKIMMYSLLDGGGAFDKKIFTHFGDAMLSSVSSNDNKTKKSAVVW